MGVAGFGMAARTFHVPLLQAASGYALCAVASSQAEAVRSALPEARIHSDALALCRDPELELIVIATPNDSHAPLAEAALKAGKHVVVDKPFALDAAEAERLVELARAEGRMLTVFHNRRWDGDFLTLKDVVASGRIGRPVELDSHFDRFRPVVRDRWRERPGPGSGVWADLGPHLVDQALQLFGWPETIWGDLAALRGGAATDDYAHVVLGYAKLRVILHATTLAAAETPRFVLHGTEGSFVIHGLDPQEEALKRGVRPGDDDWGRGAPDARLTTAEASQTVPRRPGDYGQFYARLAEAIRGDGEVPVAPEEALAVMRILDAARTSSETGRRIEPTERV